MTSTHQPQEQQLPNSSAGKQGKLPKMHSWSAIAAIGTSLEGKTMPVKILPASATSSLTAAGDVQVGMDLGPVVGEEQQIVKNRGKRGNATVVTSVPPTTTKSSLTHETKGNRSSKSRDGTNSSSNGKSMSSESNASSETEIKPIISKRNPWKIPSADDVGTNTTLLSTADGAATPTPAESKDMKTPITAKRSLLPSSASSDSKVENYHKSKTNSGR